MEPPPRNGFRTELTCKTCFKPMEEWTKSKNRKNCGLCRDCFRQKYSQSSKHKQLEEENKKLRYILSMYQKNMFEITQQLCVALNEKRNLEKIFLQQEQYPPLSDSLVCSSSNPPPPLSNTLVHSHPLRAPFDQIFAVAEESETTFHSQTLSSSLASHQTDASLHLPQQQHPQPEERR